METWKYIWDTKNAKGYKEVKRKGYLTERQNTFACEQEVGIHSIEEEEYL